MDKHLRVQEDNALRASALNYARVASLSQPSVAQTFKASIYEMELTKLLAAAKDNRDLYLKILTILKSLGFDNFSFIRLKNDEISTTYYINTNPYIKDVYDGENLWPYDLSLKGACDKEARSTYQTTINGFINCAPYESELVLKNRLIQKTIDKAGYKEYFNMPMRSCNGDGNVMLSVTIRLSDASRIRENAAKNWIQLHSLCRVIDYVIVTKHGGWFEAPTESGVRNIEGPLRLLNYMLEKDCGVKEAAQQLDTEKPISAYAASRWLATLRQTLGATSNTSLVYRALTLGLLQPPK